MPKSVSIPIDSPVDFISGPKIVSTSGNLLKGNTASFTEKVFKFLFGTFKSLSSKPDITLVAIFATEILEALETTEAEIRIMKDLVVRVAKEVQKDKKIKIDYLVGTMIELPRAAIKADDIAKHAEFFSFGTNDLTQTTFGLSRDDSGKFLNDYLENKIFSIDPFISIDDGVGDLIEIAVEKGRKTNKKIKLGICGEHGGDPKSIHFCANAGLDYVSCSPYRVPIARLAAAQAELSKKN